jgi:hypothetical protein
MTTSLLKYKCANDLLIELVLNGSKKHLRKISKKLKAIEASTPNIINLIKYQSFEYKLLFLLAPSPSQ